MIEIKNVTIKAGEFSVRDLSLTIPTGQYGLLMGKTGCGKTTLLEAVIGLKRVAAGTISLCGVDVTHTKPAVRNVGYVPQDLALFSTMTVADQLGFALRIRRCPKGKVRERVEELAALLQIGYLLGRKPQGLSGGESQRVALGRALSAHPSVLCLDEPLSSLDEDTHGEICGLLKRIQKETGVTVLHVTHNRNEAARLANTLFCMKDGRLVEPEESLSKSPE